MSTHSNLIKIMFFVTLTVIGLTESVQWINSYREEAKLSSTTFDDPGIKNFNIEFINNNIVLKVYLDKPATCDTVMNYLDIKEIRIKEKVYKPLCVITNSKLMTLTYRESKML